ncbi:hypothetical protein HanIR_Chr04g0151961 [Helianthus annuus]|nr:hypothetical protein HanIR_Chr04g0151961 [Helianthus annuus]
MGDGKSITISKNNFIRTSIFGDGVERRTIGVNMMRGTGIEHVRGSSEISSG